MLKVKSLCTLLCLTTSIGVANAKPESADEQLLSSGALAPAAVSQLKQLGAGAKTIEYQYVNNVRFEQEGASELLRQINQGSFEILETGKSTKDKNSAISAASSQPPTIAISAGQLYNDSLSSSVLEKWYIFNVASETKLTGVMQQIPQNSNYNLFLFGKPTGEAQYKAFAESSMPGSGNEQFSAIAVPGHYILVVKAAGAATNTPFLFGTLLSSSWDANEPDDSLWQASQVTLPYERKGTLDLFIDNDTFWVNYPETSVHRYTLTAGNYQAQLLAANGAVAYTLPNNTEVTLTVPTGNYYWRIYSPDGTVDPALEYTFSAKKVAPAIHRITFRNTSDSHGVNNKFSWGRGEYFGLRKQMTVSGYAFDSNNDPIEDARISFRISGGVTSDTISTFTTDANGRYSGTIHSPTNFANECYNESHGASYYDLHELVISDGRDANGTPLLRVETLETHPNGVITNEDGRMRLYDIAYYDYNDPCPEP